MKKTKNKKHNGYIVTAYCHRREQEFTWTTGKRGLEKLKRLIKYEGLTKIKVKEINDKA